MKLLSLNLSKKKENSRCKTEKNNYIADAVVLASGGFEANKEMRSKYLGDHWGVAKVRYSKQYR